MKLHSKSTFTSAFLFSALFLFSFFHTVEAATLRVSPDTGVYTAGGVFTANVVINTQSKPVNAADGQLGFNPKELSVVSVSRTNSIFNLWTEEPSFSNSAGTISFGGGSPTGYTGSAGTILSITFRSLAAGSPKVTFKSGSVLAADGLGTNVLTGMNGGSYTVTAKTENPEPEYVAPANTPKAPVVTSTTHNDDKAWYKATTAELKWVLPNDVTAVRTLLDESAGTIPTIVYDEPISSRTLDELPQGVSYFHIQFKNAEGWGKITHYRLGVDSEIPADFVISEAEDQDQTNPARTLEFQLQDISPITTYKVQIDGGEPVEFKDDKETKRYTLPVLLPGHHTVVVEAFDSAGNSAIANYTFDIASFERPVFTEYPTKLSAGVIPALKGSTRGKASLTITVKQVGTDAKEYTVVADEAGLFTFIPDAPLGVGVYDIIAVATDAYGAMSEPSESIRIAVEEPGYMRIGSFMISVLSIVVPLLSLLLLMIFGCWYLWHRLVIWKRKLEKETTEAEDTLKIELDEVITNLNVKVAELKESRKGKLTRQETALIEQIELDLNDARAKVRKEIEDIEHITQ